MSTPDPSTVETTDGLDFALEVKRWELANLSYFCEGALSQRLFLAFATASHKKIALRLSEIFVDGNASEVGIRKRLKHYERLGLIEIVANPSDKRTKLVKPTEKLESLLSAYFAVVQDLWQTRAHNLQAECPSTDAVKPKANKESCSLRKSDSNHTHAN